MFGWSTAEMLDMVVEQFKSIRVAWAVGVVLRRKVD
jgi:hypothetical protein